MRSRIYPVKKFARTVRAHRELQDRARKVAKAGAQG